MLLIVNSIPKEAAFDCFREKFKRGLKFNYMETKALLFFMIDYPKIKRQSIIPLHAKITNFYYDEKADFLDLEQEKQVQEAIISEDGLLYKVFNSLNSVYPEEADELMRTLLKAFSD